MSEILQQIIQRAVARLAEENAANVSDRETMEAVTAIREDIEDLPDGEMLTSMLSRCIEESSRGDRLKRRFVRHFWEEAAKVLGPR